MPHVCRRGLTLLVALAIAGSARGLEPFCTDSTADLNCRRTTQADAQLHPATDDLLLVAPRSGAIPVLPGTVEGARSVQDIPVATNPGSPRTATFPIFTAAPRDPARPPAHSQAVAGGRVAGSAGKTGGVARSLAPAAQNAWRDLVSNLYQGQSAVRDWILAPLNAWLGLGDSTAPALATGHDRQDDGLAPQFNFALASESPDEPDAASDNLSETPGGGVGSRVLDPYLAWLARNGLYADLSYRRPEPWGLVATGAQVKVTDAVNGWSLETGYPLRTVTGMVIEPRLQFSAAAVTFEQLGHFFYEVEFDDRYSTQSRAGVQLRKTYDLGYGMRLTPSGSVNALTQVQGGNSFVTNDVGWNTTDLNGTRLLLEGGLNAEIGRQTEVFGGMNYQDDGTDDSLGGEMGVRVRW